MRDEMKKAPRLRFRGFQEDWELCKLKEIVDVRSGRDYKHLGSGNIPVYGTGGYMLSVSEALSYDEDAIGIGRKGTINNPYILKAPFWTVDTLFYAIPKNNFDLNFIYSIFRKINWKSKDESTGVPSLSKTTINAVTVYIPSGSEQQRIGEFFKQIDNTITLHQRELDQLKELKKAYLQLMFPVKDERVPKLRFADFEGEWEQCKFFDMWEKSSDRNKELKYSSKDVLSVAKMTKNPVERNSSDEYMKTYNILHYGDIAFEGNKSKDYSFGRFVLNNLQDGIVSHVFIVFKPKVKMDIDFMKVYINNEYFMKHHLVKATTKTLMMTTLNVQDMNKQKLRIPSLNEQERIGKFFKELDHAITLHQNKLTQLKSLKKSYLQNMFI
ncbi:MULTISPECIES: restriction endonuclease subunit S [Enterococcus]|uniref:Restriction endonuclease subunit S n=6 Tax=Enterococcus faecalis TaxID=1351 RepID=A0A7H0FNB4_ENTFL|nr:restriction endonuclease subunit S [Enterococcus faecalis]EGO2661021.1 restriction endonuclease subunit S [Enterococcus faecalis]EGO5235914.1 restriction endonuclease subunit S [Enterococcus faecalis]EGO6145352.1 restriction endonuclease subunit S [Enterococcus faecalis]EGO8291115.1 restriction endonuclease subunit S [Enterococcus faecalis]EGO8489963.1 restriction endonuclease subunit S [Enterococcus faecalis]